ncbi:MAG: RNA polymerase sigma factor [Mariniblastus sp.]
MTTETPVLPKVASGDSAAVAECMKRYGNLVWSLARRSCPDVQAAEDATQDIFLKLWKVSGKFNPDIASETTFVAMITRRHLIDLSRKKNWQSSSSVELDSFTNSDMDVAARFEINDEAAKAAEFLNDLPSDQQQVIRLGVYDGLSHSRISEATGLSLGTVKTHMRRGLMKLRKSLFALNQSLSEESPRPSLADGEASV